MSSCKFFSRKFLLLSQEFKKPHRNNPSLHFSPGDYENVDEEYKFAKAAGKHGVDCLKMYPRCPLGHGFLDTNSIIHDFRFDRILTAN